MDSFSASAFKLKRIYCIPTWRGLFMFAIIGAALWYALQNESGVDLWVGLLMILLSLVYLIEVSDPFRGLQITILPFEPPFAGEETRIPLLVSNPTPSRSPPLALQLKGDKFWVQTLELPAHSSQMITLPFYSSTPGQRVFSNLRVKMLLESQLFRFWRQGDFKFDFYVLPRAVDHQRLPLAAHKKSEESELEDPELIRDPRLLPKLDRKLFQKTGLPYHRPFQGLLKEGVLSFNWKDLESLGEEKRGEQFSFWIKSAWGINGQPAVLIETPFFSNTKKDGLVSSFKLKVAFSNWLYARS